MSILIKGMTIPKDRPQLFWVYPNGKVLPVQSDEDPWKDLQAVSIPPHGRLIDADELRGWYDFHSYDVDDDDFLTEEKFDKLMVATAVVRQNIDDAPTIIESEE